MNSKALWLALLTLITCQLHAVLAGHASEEVVKAAAPAPSSSCQEANGGGADDASAGVDVPTLPRGGGGGVAKAVHSVDNTTRDTILRFLSSSAFDPRGDYTFHVQGMRWHQMAIIRDLRRLDRLSRYLHDNDDDDNGYKSLNEAADYVINFNMAAWFRIQKDLFVDFFKKQINKDTLASIAVDGGVGAAAEIADAFQRLIETLVDFRIQSEMIGKEVVRYVFFLMLVYVCITYLSNTETQCTHLVNIPPVQEGE